MAGLLNIWYFSCPSMGSLWSEMWLLFGSHIWFPSQWEQKVWDWCQPCPLGQRGLLHEGSQDGCHGWQPGWQVSATPLAWLTEQGRAGNGVWGQSQPRDHSHSGSGGTWLWCSSGKDFQAEWGPSDKAPCSTSSSQLWPRHRSWSEHRQAEISEKERGHWPSRYTQSLASVLPNLKEEVNITTRLPTTPGDLDTSQCHLQESPWSAMPQWGHSKTSLAFGCSVALGFAPCHSTHPSASTDTSTPSTHHLLLQCLAIYSCLFCLPHYSRNTLGS